MNPSEAWSLLTVRASNLGKVSRGHSALTKDDIAFMLGGLDRYPFLMGMAAECADMDALKQIELVLWVKANGFAEDGKWELRRGEWTTRRLAGLALYEAINDRRCTECNGKGIRSFVLRDAPGLVFAPSFQRLNEAEGQLRCEACFGSGVVRLSGRKKADLAGVNKDTWARLWSRRYELIYRIANDWREDAKRHLASKLREHNDIAA